MQLDTKIMLQVEFQPVVKLEEVKTQTMEEDEEVLFKMCVQLTFVQSSTFRSLFALVASF